MAFSQKRTAPPPLPPTEPLNKGEIGHDHAALIPDARSVHEVEMRDPASLNAAIADARTQAVRAMNSARMLTPAIRAAAAEGGTDREQAARFVALLNTANHLAKVACEKWSLDPEMLNSRWAMNSLERVFVEALAGVGMSTPSEASLLVSALVDAANVRACNKEDWTNPTESTVVQAALLKGLVPVWRAYRDFDFLKAQEPTMALCAQKLLDTAGEAVISLVSPLTPAAERRTLFQIFVEEGGIVLASIWEAEARQAKKAMANKSVQAIQAWRRANPDGLPMDSVWKTFQVEMARLVKLSGLSRPQVRAPHP